MAAAALDRSARPPSWTRGSRRSASTTTRCSARPSIRCWATWARSPRAARIVPETRDGKSAGFRLFSVRPDGPFAKIGLLNGDVVSAINGLEMTSPDQALLAYTKLKTANHLSVAIERNGQKITKDYNIR